MQSRILDFLVIGAQKAGTTFLHRALRNHPQVYIPYVKELNYFNSIKYNYLSKRKRVIFEQLFFKKARIKQYFNKKEGIKEFKWDVNYFLLPPGPNWYRRCFLNASKYQISGELSPLYADLSLDVIKKMKEEVGTIKIILLLRNPVERDLSQIKMEQRQLTAIASKQRLDINTFLYRFAFSDAVSKKSDYERIINNYVSVFGKENVFVGLYEEMTHNPLHFFTGLYSFLKIDLNIPDIAEKVNKGTELELPIKLREELYKRHFSTIKYMNSIFKNSYTIQMLEKAKSYL